jgi:hypothetical protein
MGFFKIPEGTPVGYTSFGFLSGSSGPDAASAASVQGSYLRPAFQP